MPLQKLKRIPIFTGLDEALLHRLASLGRTVHLPTEGMVFRDGEEADALFVILEGSVVLLRDRVGAPMQLLARLEPGDYFGEMCLFDEVYRRSSARGSAGTALLKLDKQGLIEILSREPRLALRLQLAAAHRRNLDAAAALELGRRVEVRIRLAASMTLGAPGQPERAVVMENLSIGGMCVSGAPEAWEIGETVTFALSLGAYTTEILARVAWRRGETIGLAFDERRADHEQRILRILRELAGAWPQG